jgi:membrane-associated phospholipid phosphatase
MPQDRFLNWQSKLEQKPWYRRFWVFFGIYSLAAVFLVGAYLLLVGDYKLVFLALVAFVIGRLVLSPLIFVFYKKQRPYQRLKFSTTFSYFLSPEQKHPNSFPSDHAVSFAAIAAVLFWYMPGLGVLMFVLTLVASYARVVLGYHDEFDIIAGWGLGIFSAILAIGFIAPLLFTGR